MCFNGVSVALSRMKAGWHSEFSEHRAWREMWKQKYLTHRDGNACTLVLEKRWVNSEDVSSLGHL